MLQSRPQKLLLPGRQCAIGINRVHHLKGDPAVGETVGTDEIDATQHVALIIPSSVHAPFDGCRLSCISDAERHFYDVATAQLLGRHPATQQENNYEEQRFIVCHIGMWIEHVWVRVRWSEIKDKPEVFKYLWHSCNIFIYCLQIYELFPILPNKRGKKSKSFWHFARLIVSLRLRLEDRPHMTSSTSVTTRPNEQARWLSLLHRFGNENKSRFILHFARFALSLYPNSQLIVV